MINNIDVLKLLPHPDNPRKDIGDITELAASIQSQGILQNLTVVPHADGGGFYTVIIGHRRLAAAKLAGLTFVPCAISDMDPKQQVATMLLENIQRNDLTILEQAHGFQMLLDFGESVDDVARRTGFSDATIRRRVKLLELDADKFKASVARGATLQDYAELDKIKDSERKNEVLEAVGTDNFQWSLKQAIDQESRDFVKPIMIKEIEQFAEQVDDPASKVMNHCRYYAYRADFQIQKPDDAGKRKYFFCVGKHGIDLYVEFSRKQNYQGLDRQQLDELKNRRQHLNEIEERAFELRRQFVKEYAGAKKHAGLIMKFAIQAFMVADGWTCHDEDIIEFLEIDPPSSPDADDDSLTFDSLASEFNISPERTLLCVAYACVAAERQNGYHLYNCEYNPNGRLDAIYDCLIKLGYQMSDEERALRDGTHELYVREDNDGNNF